MRRPSQRSGLGQGVVAVTLAGLCMGLAAQPAQASRASHRGPALSVPKATLKASLSCRGDLAHAKRPPVLLLPDYASAEESYGWNFAQALPRVGVPVCLLDLEHRGTDDLQVEAEHVVYAVRKMHKRSGRRVVVVGHAYIALAQRWALTFWPDVRAAVSDSISIAAPEQGTTLTSGVCQPGGMCPSSAWQTTPGSAFLQRINRGRLPRGPAYTTIATRNEELIFPAPDTSSLRGASNVVLQDLCPGRLSDHFLILGDSLTYRLVLDALEHRGPADPSRLPANRCQEQLMPGVTEQVANIAVAALKVFALFPVNIVRYAVPREPELRRYATR